MCSVKDIISLNLNADTVDYEETDYKWKSYKSITHKVCNLTRRFIKQRWFIVIPALFDLCLVDTLLERWSYFTSNTYNDTLALRWGVIVDHQLLFIFSQPARLVFKSFTLARETNFSSLGLWKFSESCVGLTLQCGVVASRCHQSSG